MAAVQGSLLDSGDDVGIRPMGSAVERTVLAHDAWVDFRRGWITQSHFVFDALLRDVPWQKERRRMYDRMVDVPRLSKFYGTQDLLPHVVVQQAMEALVAHYGTIDGEPVATAGLCLYRHGDDSVAWHGDTIGRGRTENILVAIVSLGATRRLLLRRRGGGPALRFQLESGDLLVMGGSCQRTWEHAIPKTRRPVGARISVQFRPEGAR